jgi:hypothetical protein
MGFGGQPDLTAERGTMWWDTTQAWGLQNIRGGRDALDVGKLLFLVSNHTCMHCIVEPQSCCEIQGGALLG